MDLDDLIDDDVRRSFPGFTDKEIYDFYLAAKSVEVKEQPSIFESDLSHARIIRELGFDAFKEYLKKVTGTDYLAVDDYIALTDALSYLREIENTSLYAAIYGAAAEAQNKKTVSSRKESYASLTQQLKKFTIAEGI
jgi:hypothetical protein